MRKDTDETARRLGIRILQNLIRIRTHQPDGNEKDLVKYILELLPEGVFENTVVDHGGNRASLAAMLPGRRRDRAVAFVGHLDTVAVGRSVGWSHPPFAADLEDDSVYGRGAANMKGGLTSMILCALSLASRADPPPQDVYFSFNADGDYNGYGAECLAAGGYLGKVREFFFLDPTECKIGIRQKGALWLDVGVTGKFSYSCFPEHGINAVEAFMEFVRKVENMLRNEFKSRINADWRPTCVPTKISSEAEEELNYTVPNRARGFLDIRTLPGADHQRIVEKIGEIAAVLESEKPPLEITFDVVNNRLPIAMSPDAPTVRKVEKIIRELGRKPEKKGLNFFTDASRLIPILGVPFVIFGPGTDIFCTLKEENVSMESVLFVKSVIERYALEEVL